MNLFKELDRDLENGGNGDMIYWRNRERALLDIQADMKRDQGYKAALTRIYHETERDVNNEIAAELARYTDREGISLKRAQSLVSKLDIAGVEQLMKEREISPEMKREYNVTMRNNRLELLNARVGIATASLASKEEGLTRSYVMRSAMDEYTKRAGILGITVPSIKELERNARALADAEFRGVTFADRIWQDQNELTKQLDTTIRRVVMQGKNPRDALKDLKGLVSNEFKKKKYAADRIAITETARVQGEMHKQSYNDAEIDMYEYIAEPQSKGQCSICRNLDTKKFKVSEMQAGLNMFPMHPFCRCSTAAYIPRNQLDVRLREIKAGERKNTMTTTKVPDPKPADDDDWDLGQVPLSDSMYENLDMVQTTAAMQWANEMPRDIVNVWTKKLNDLVIGNPNARGTAHFDPNYNWVNMNIKADFGRSGEKQAGRTFFHEFGHNIDFTSGSRYHGLPYSAEYREGNMTFGKSIRSEVRAFYKKKHKDDMMSARDDLMDAVYNLPGEDAAIRRGLSDLMGGATKNELNIGSGHRTAYWGRNVKDQEEMLGVEGFAHYFSAYARNNESEIALFKQFLPESSKMFDRMIKELGS